MFKRLHHVGIAVPSLDEGAKAWGPTGLGLLEEGREEVTSASTKIAMFPVGESRIELLEPMGDDSPVGKFLSKRGPGIHHLCFEVEDIEAEIIRIAASGMRLLGNPPSPGAHGSLVAFIHPADTGGVLVELNQFADDQG
ncbi:MAG: methylmalonyl-CoA epimerase [Rickettsiales bacterium]|nr:methylmalonyl-CoA epimerase [Rickettsiales bacterium]|tara:strand:+ start:747 stop:1163 length:417 start_codon:yes stop_codon:yes gene_type:complete